MTQQAKLQCAKIALETLGVGPRPFDWTSVEAEHIFLDVWRVEGSQLRQLGFDLSLRNQKLLVRFKPGNSVLSELSNRWGEIEAEEHEEEDEEWIVQFLRENPGTRRIDARAYRVIKSSSDGITTQELAAEIDVGSQNISYIIRKLGSLVRVQKGHAHKYFAN